MDRDKPNIFSNRYVDTRKPGQGFLRLMFVWHGSVFKLIWPHLLAFIVVYSLLSILYRNIFLTNEVQREWFELICVYASRFSSKIPVTFMTGFYVANVVSRYWDQYLSLPMMHKLAYKLVACIPGKGEYQRTMRRTIMRQVNLSTILVFRRVCNKVLARFPTYRSLVDAGLMLPQEAEYLGNLDKRSDHETAWAPILWAINLLQKEKATGRFQIEPPVYASLISSFEYIETSNRRIFDHGWVNFPLAYTQVITITIYSYLFANLFGHQFLEPRDDAPNLDLATFSHLGVKLSLNGPFANHTPIIYVPIFTIIEFIAYLGWIKVAECLLNPWGDDDEDFQVNYLIDRNFQTSMMIVDEELVDFDLVPDNFMVMKKSVPSELPYNGRRSLRSRRSLVHDMDDGMKHGMQSPVLTLKNRLLVRRSRPAAYQLRHLNRRLEPGFETMKATATCPNEGTTKATATIQRIETKASNLNVTQQSIITKSTDIGVDIDNISTILEP